MNGSSEALSHLAPLGYTAVATYLGLLLVIGFFVQIVTLRILLKKEYRNKRLTPYLINIVASNSLVILGCFPTSFAAALNHGWPFSEALCRLNGLLTGVGCISMLCTMACMSFTIWAKIVSGDSFNHVIQLATRHRSGKVIFAVWLYSVALMVPPSIGLTKVKKEAANTNCVPDWSPKRFQDRIYIIVLTIGAFVLPVLVSAFALYKTHKALRQHVAVMTAVISNFKVDYCRQIVRMSALSVAVFTLEWLPYTVYVIVCLVHGNGMFASSPGLTMIPGLVAKSSVIVNPFIYACVVPKFRSDFLRFFGFYRNVSVAPSNDVTISCLHKNRPINKPTLVVRREQKSLSQICESYQYPEDKSNEVMQLDILHSSRHMSFVG